MLKEARRTVAQCLGCEAEEVYFTSGGSESDNQTLRTAALVEWETERDARERYLENLCTRLIQGLAEIDGAHLTGGDVDRLAGHVHFCFEDIDGEALMWRLDDCGICVSTGSACHALSGSGEEGYVLRAMGIDADLARGAIRMALSYTNTEEEVESVIRETVRVVREMRRLSHVEL